MSCIPPSSKRRASPRARIVFVSTASVTTAPERTAITEEAPYAGHANTYSRSKREAEQLLMASGLDPVIVRPSIVLSRGIHDRQDLCGVMAIVVDDHDAPGFAAKMESPFHTGESGQALADEMFGPIVEFLEIIRRVV